MTPKREKKEAEAQGIELPPADAGELEWRRRLLDASHRQKVALRRIENILGSTSGMTCLTIGAGPAELERLELLGARGTGRTRMCVSPQLFVRWWANTRR
jgi:hypothetical protein